MVDSEAAVNAPLSRTHPPTQHSNATHRPPYRTGPCALRGDPALAHTDGVDDSTLVEQLRALGDPVRWAIVRELQGGTRCACELAQLTEVSSTLLSHHLKVLREAEVITGVKRGRWIDYTLEAAAIGLLATRITSPEVAALPQTPVAHSPSRHSASRTTAASKVSDDRD